MACISRRQINGKWLHLKLFKIGSAWSFIRALIGWPSLLVGLFFLAALLGSVIPANSRWQQPDDGVEIFVETNGIHVSLVLPMVAAGEDLTDLIRPDHLSQPQLFGTHAMVGWGHKAVYRNARTWSDVQSGDITSATFGSDQTTLHVYHLTNPVALQHRKMLHVTNAQYRSIVAQVRATFRLDRNGQSVAYPAYGADNIFYDSVGHYNAINTCNTWTGRVLKRAGVRIGIWTPLAGGVMRWF
jgi:uncharacterized protein (TIGR02117 family)